MTRQRTRRSKQAAAKRSKRRWILLFVAMVAVGGLLMWMAQNRPRERRLDETRLPTLVSGEDLPAVSIANFRRQHPRLPAPSAADIARILEENPKFFDQHRRRAQAENEVFDSRTLMAFVDPGSQNLEKLHAQLMALEFEWRGHQQVKPIAVAYDWLYDHWSSAQRYALRDKAIEGCDYIVGRIREERLSPYNVYLYNSPLQALVACVIAVYQDAPQAESAMRFTYDYLHRRMLPVWNQIMGSNGGWHEGGEYIGIGIGQAVYQIPALWARGTGEDLFSRVAGIAGFLEFLIYRTRPDGTDFRWGDAGFFDRAVPDQIPLAIKFHHAAGFSLRRARAPAVTPTAWPWGPLPDSSLHDSQAIERLPLTRFFDGLGLFVGRSTWGDRATYVTFKAGDNYWSHMHLDQGAFTIYKGGALAIDSGLYGPKYGSDHHMNYSYQTIAHNTLVVRDPRDVIPIPAGNEKPARSIANDGGQRRVGSGWSIEAAPLDRAEWENKREIYHTGAIKARFEQHGLSVFVADLTPAYTNHLSGKGTFSHRTRRVEKLTRIFVYDRVNDVVVVFDQVIATTASFRKTWLLHTINEPVLSADGFRVAIEAGGGRGRAGGILQGHVLWPRNAVVNMIGGPGFEYFVDGQNFDEQGGIRKTAQKKPNVEPGAWRVEISPAGDNYEDNFLVVMVPRLRADTDEIEVHATPHEGGGFGCEITGGQRTTGLHFRPAQDQVEVKIQQPSGLRTFVIEPGITP